MYSAQRWPPCKACTTLILVSKKRFKQLVKHCSSELSKFPEAMGLLALHFLKHMSVKLWMDICTFDLEFSDSTNCIMSFLEASSRLRRAACEMDDICVSRLLSLAFHCSLDSFSVAISQIFKV